MKIKAFALIMVFAVLGCASTDFIVPSLERRTLDISRTFPGFIYRYPVCVKKFLGMCRKWETVVDEYHLDDEKTRNELIAMGFVLKVRERLSP